MSGSSWDNNRESPNNEGQLFDSPLHRGCPTDESSRERQGMSVSGVRHNESDVPQPDGSGTVAASGQAARERPSENYTFEDAAGEQAFRASGGEIIPITFRSNTGQQIALPFPRTMLIRDLEAHLTPYFGPGPLRLIYRGRAVTPPGTIGDYIREPGHTVHVVARRQTATQFPPQQPQQQTQESHQQQQDQQQRQQAQVPTQHTFSAILTEVPTYISEFITNGVNNNATSFGSTHQQAAQSPANAFFTFPGTGSVSAMTNVPLNPSSVAQMATSAVQLAASAAQQAIGSSEQNLTNVMGTSLRDRRVSSNSNGTIPRPAIPVFRTPSTNVTTSSVPFQSNPALSQQPPNPLFPIAASILGGPSFQSATVPVSINVAGSNSGSTGAQQLVNMVTQFLPSNARPSPETSAGIARIGESLVRNVVSAALSRSGNTSSTAAHENPAPTPYQRATSDIASSTAPNGSGELPFPNRVDGSSTTNLSAAPPNNSAAPVSDSSTTGAPFGDVPGSSTVGSGITPVGISRTEGLTEAQHLAAFLQRLIASTRSARRGILRAEDVLADALEAAPSFRNLASATASAAAAGSGAITDAWTAPDVEQPNHETRQRVLYVPHEFLAERLPWQALNDLGECLRTLCGWNLPAIAGRVTGTQGSSPLATFLLVYGQLRQISNSILAQLQAWQSGTGTVGMSAVGHAVRMLALETQINAALASFIAWLFLSMVQHVQGGVLTSVLNDIAPLTAETSSSSAQQLNASTFLQDAGARLPLCEDHEEFLDAVEADVIPEQARQSASGSTIDREVQVEENTDASVFASRSRRSPRVSSNEAPMNSERKRRCSTASYAAPPPSKPSAEGTSLSPLSCSGFHSNDSSPKSALNKVTKKSNNEIQCGVHSGNRATDQNTSDESRTEAVPMVNCDIPHVPESSTSVDTEMQTRASVASIQESAVSNAVGEENEKQMPPPAKGSQSLATQESRNAVTAGGSMIPEILRQLESIRSPNAPQSSNSGNNGIDRLPTIARARYERWVNEGAKAFSKNVVAGARFQRCPSYAYQTGDPYNPVDQRSRPTAPENAFALVWRHSLSRLNIQGIASDVPERLITPYLGHLLSEFAKITFSHPDFAENPDLFPNLKRLRDILEDNEE